MGALSAGVMAVLGEGRERRAYASRSMPSCFKWSVTSCSDTERDEVAREVWRARRIEQSLVLRS